MKEKISSRLNHFLLILLSFLPSILIIRLTEAAAVIYQQSFSWAIVTAEFLGYIQDNLIFFSVAILLLLPFFLISFINGKAGRIFAILFLLLVITLNFLLELYFLRTLVPLDQVIFFYSMEELWRIAVSSTQINPFELVVYFTILASFLFTYRRLQKVKVGTAWYNTTFLILILSPFLSYFTKPTLINFANNFEYFIQSNKTGYLTGRIFDYKFKPVAIDLNDPSFSAVVARYHNLNQKFNYPGSDNPLLRFDRTPDMLGPYFNFGPQKPNIVVVIVESLTTSFVGKQPYYGSFMPFLDSIIGKSLYWQNCLATSERTFNVLPAVFGSLPFSKELFRMPEAPSHFSLIRYLGDNGYFTSFFYGGDHVLGGIQTFLEHEQTDFTLPYFNQQDNKSARQEKLYIWGSFDGTLFQQSMRALDSLKQSPRLDMYLTLSTHAPFITPDEKRYGQLFNDRLKMLNLPAEIKRMVSGKKYLFTTILYTDEALRALFNDYRKRMDFDNTIFIITGDHAMPELSYSYINPLEKYHVPLVIYSPMLKHPETFDAVSSHLDIAPSVLAMLENQGFIKLRTMGHWLGEGLDVSKAFRCRPTISFILNNRSEVDYLRQEYYLSEGRLFRLLPGFKLVSVNNPEKLKSMTNELRDYLQISDKIANTRAIIPDSLLFYENYTASPYAGTTPVDYQDSATNDQYISILTSHLVGDEYDMIGLDLTISLHASDSHKSPPLKIVFQVLDDHSENLVWLQYPLIKDSTDGSEDFYRSGKIIDLGHIADIGSKHLAVYIYNPDKNGYIVSDLKCTVTGYRRKY
jgi:phosphoglycerol transferase MdoB-like AlkP superfamily enzyme